jgi:hypothetical protein
MSLFLKLPFVVRALILWLGVLFGVCVGLYFSISENGSNDQPLQLLGAAGGHIIAWTCGIFAFLMPSPWSTED